MSWNSSVAIPRHEGGQQSSGSDTVHTIGKGLSTLGLGHVSANKCTQDCWAVASILDALINRLRLKLPALRTVCIITDIARNFQNDVIPVLAPFLSASHG